MAAQCSESIGVLPTFLDPRDLSLRHPHTLGDLGLG